jgi:hypothetical protein
MSAAHFECREVSPGPVSQRFLGFREACRGPKDGLATPPKRFAQPQAERSDCSQTPPRRAARSSQARPCGDGFRTPPRRRGSGFNKSPPPAPRQPKLALLRAALLRRSYDETFAAIQKDPGVVRDPFHEGKLEPVICCAAQYWCGSSIIGLLHDKGADVNARDAAGSSGLLILVRGNRLPGAWGVTESIYAIVGKLLECGADPLLADDSGVTPLDEAAKRNDVELVNMFHSHTDVCNARKAFRMEETRAEPEQGSMDVLTSDLVTAVLRFL